MKKAQGKPWAFFYARSQGCKERRCPHAISFHVKHGEADKKTFS